ncbi:PREDICTED: uncharacterized protein LOC109468437 [Branchiostoma belcheri]|uniref:Uncharacterized protein LOC109468437 n=1 Tax=Branchiostoma belcheri TaxID=7741 RepID=A0A6P4YUC8_BRABE|nr:PREDICTED: uncharacterized protein LOC109468437 [Branchiostoma belcheri]
MADRLNSIHMSYPPPATAQRPVQRSMINGTANGVGFPVRAMDPSQLKARLVSMAPQQAPINTQALRMRGPTKAQMNTRAQPIAPKLEPLVYPDLYLHVMKRESPMLQSHQERNQPAYIHQVARQALLAQGKIVPSPVANGKARPTSSGKRRKLHTVDPLEPPPTTTSPLPDLPEHLQHKQIA